MRPVDEYQAAQVRDSASNRLAELEERLHAFPARTREIVADAAVPTAGEPTSPAYEVWADTVRASG